MAYATFEHDGQRQVGRVVPGAAGDRLVSLDGLRELGQDTTVDDLARAAEQDTSVPVSEVHLCPVVPNPDKIICIELNYLTHVGETGRELPTYPVMFTKFASSLIGARDDILIPAESGQIDYEAELAVVIGRAGRRIARERAAEHVLGYTVANDITMRDYQYKTHQWLQGKAWDRSTPLGPYLLTPDEVDISAAGIRTLLRGEKLQESDTSRLIFDIPTLISTISEFTTLLPGDVILTGTPGGVGFHREPQLFLTDGDEITVEATVRSLPTPPPGSLISSCLTGHCFTFQDAGGRRFRARHPLSRAPPPTTPPGGIDAPLPSHLERARGLPRRLPHVPEPGHPGRRLPGDLCRPGRVALAAPIVGVVQADLGASAAALAWIPASFILPTAILELNFGVLGDLFGRRRLLVGGGVFIAVGDIVAATSGSLPQLITGQAIAGLGAAAIFPSSLAVIVAATPQAKARAQALSYWAVSLAFGAMAAPLISGFVAEHVHWGWAFVPPAVLGLITAAISARFIVDSRQPAGRGLDWPGQITIAVALLALLYAVIQGSTAGYAAPQVLAAFVVAVAAFVGFFVAERRSRTPMLRLELFRVPSFAAAAVIGFLALFGFIGTAYALSIKLEAILHVSTLQAALPFALIQAIPLLATPFLPRLLQRVHPRILLVGGLLALAAGQVWMALLPGDTVSLAAITEPILLLGIGFITMFSALTAVAVGAVDISYAGMASAVTASCARPGRAAGRPSSGPSPSAWPATP